MDPAVMTPIIQMICDANQNYVPSPSIKIRLDVPLQRVRQAYMYYNVQLDF